jgi:hypothetical protein
MFSREGTRRCAPVLRRALTPTQHTRIGAVGLLRTGFVGVTNGESWRPSTEIITNPHTPRPLPNWLTERLARYEDPTLD